MEFVLGDKPILPYGVAARSQPLPIVVRCNYHRRHLHPTVLIQDDHLGGRLDFGRGASRYWRRHPWHWVKARGLVLGQALGLLARLTLKVSDASLSLEHGDT